MATGDKKRAVMTDDINNSGSSYPVLGPTGDGSNVTAAFTAASTRANISTGDKLSVICGKIAKWFTDLGAAAFRGVDAAPTSGSTNLVESGGVKSAITKVEDDIAIRVVGNKTTYANGAAIGQYVIVDGSTITGIADGLYKAAKAIPYNTVIDSTYLTAVSGGVANDLKSALSYNGGKVTNANDATDFYKSYYAEIGASNTPDAGSWWMIRPLLVFEPYVAQIAVTLNPGNDMAFHAYLRTNKIDATWTSWKQIV